MTTNLPAVPDVAPVIARPAVDSWVDVVSDVSTLSTAIASTEFVPRGYRGKPDAIMATVLHGRELGLGPMTALAITDSIEGRPTLSAEGARSLYLAAGHELHVVESTSARCEARGRRRGTETWTTVVWTIDDARQAGLLGKPNWKGHPRRMLQARATAELIHLIAPDVLHGMIMAEEADDYAADVTVSQVEPAPATSRVKRTTKPGPKLDRVDRVADPAPTRAPAPVEIDVEPPTPDKPAAAQASDPAAEIYEAEFVDAPPPAPPAPPASAPRRATNAQLSMLGALWGDLGVKDPEQRRQATATLVRRELAGGSTRDLTTREASDLIEALNRCTEADDPRAAIRALVTSARLNHPDSGEASPQGDDTEKENQQ